MRYGKQMITAMLILSLSATCLACLSQAGADEVSASGAVVSLSDNADDDIIEITTDQNSVFISTDDLKTYKERAQSSANTQIVIKMPHHTTITMKSATICAISTSYLYLTYESVDVSDYPKVGKNATMFRIASNDNADWNRGITFTREYTGITSNLKAYAVPNEVLGDSFECTLEDSLVTFTADRIGLFAISGHNDPGAPLSSSSFRVAVAIVIIIAAIPGLYIFHTERTDKRV